MTLIQDPGAETILIREPEAGWTPQQAAMGNTPAHHYYEGYLFAERQLGTPGLAPEDRQELGDRILHGTYRNEPNADDGFKDRMLEYGVEQGWLALPEEQQS